MSEELGKKNNYKIINDFEKGYIHCEPIPDEEALNILYKDHYHKDANKEYKGPELDDQDWLETLYKDKYETFNDYLGGGSYSILDIGCGDGNFLLYGKNMGWDCHGIEPSEAVANYAISNGVNVINSKFERCLYEDHKLFDVIHMHHVLEHLPEPSQLINDAATLLSENGLICIVVPNDFSPFQKILANDLGMKQWWVAPPHHINYFSADSLSDLLEKNGFEILKKEGSFPMELFLLFGDDYIEEPSLGRLMHNKRKKFDLILSRFNNTLKRQLYQSLANLNIGRDIIIYARKR